MSGGWGVADTGGAWSACNNTCSSLFSVSGGVGRVSVRAGGGPEAVLGSVSSTATDVRADVSVDRAATGGGTYVSLVARGGWREGYRGKARLMPNGSVQLFVVRTSAGADTNLGSASLPAGTFAAGGSLSLRVQAVGTAPTSLKFKVWKTGEAEPSGWQVSVTDSAAAWQKPGAVGFAAYVSSSSTNAPAVVSLDNLSAVSMGNQVPVAGFTTSVEGLSVTVDGSSSVDPDGSIVSYAWEFGDGATATGVKPPAHVYAQPGTYDVSLTVTDDAQATDKKTKQVTATLDAGVTVNVAGDLGYCGPNGQPNAVATLLDSLAGPLIAPGDIAYPDGSASDFANCYDPIFGRFKQRTYPVPGNHEYHSAQAQPYFDYFGSRVGDTSRPYYSMDIGDWHFVMLNSNCTEIGGCGVGSAQERWLTQDLAGSNKMCKAAVWHHPRFTSSDKGFDANVVPLWDAFQSGGGDIIFNGHAHHYERFAPMNSAGVRSPSGVRQFVVGTGGAALYPFVTTAPGSESRGGSFGVLKMDLHTASYSWDFVPVAGSTFTDSGSGTC